MANAKKSVVKKATQAAIRKATKTVSEKVVKPIKAKVPTEIDKKSLGFYELGKSVGRITEKNAQKLQQQQMQAGPTITARLSFELDEANNCKINVSGDFNVILKKMHEIQDQSITVDKAGFYRTTPQIMKAEQN